MQQREYEMNAQSNSNLAPKLFGTKVAPFLVVLLAGGGARTSLATTHPTVALLLFLWIVSDTIMLALIARSPSRRPSWHAIVGALAAASITVWLGSPAALRQALMAMPMITTGMAIVVLIHVAWATARAGREFRRSDASAKGRWIAAASEFVPPALVRFAAAELSVIHMALFRWGGLADVPADSRPFSYHKHLTPMCAALLALSIIEVAVYHLLVGHWNRTAAFVMFIFSDAGLIYLIGLIKSFRFRPVLMTPQGVRIRAGILIDRLVPLDTIASVETNFAGTDVRDPATLNAALIAWPNIVLRLNEPVARRSFLRRREPFSMIVFRLDNPEPFVRLLKWRLDQSGSRL